MKIDIRQNLFSRKYYVYVLKDDESFDIWQFNKYNNALLVKNIIEEDLKITEWDCLWHFLKENIKRLGNPSLFLIQNLQNIGVKIGVKL